MFCSMNVSPLHYDNPTNSFQICLGPYSALSLCTFYNSSKAPRHSDHGPQMHCARGCTTKNKTTVPPPKTMAEYSIWKNRKKT